MPDIAASWGWIPTIIAVGSMAYGMVRKSVHIEEATEKNTQDIKKMKDTYNDLREFTTEFRVWRDGHEREAHQRSKRLDTISTGVSDMAKAFNEVATAHEGRISRIEGRLNGT